MTRLPTDWNARQWALDQDITTGEPYEAAKLDSKAVLRSLEEYGDYRAPRGQRCYEFDGVNDNVLIPSFTGIKGFKAQVFIPSTATSFRRLVSWNSNQFSIYHNGTAALVFYWADAVIASKPTPAMDKWAEAEMQFDGVNVVCKYDGEVIDTVAVSDITGTHDLQIGIIGTAQKFQGFMRAIDIRDVNSQIIAQYHCNEEDGLIAYDSSGNNNQGDILNANLENFHATDPGVTANPANDVGFTDNAGVIVPRDESAPTLDVLGGALQYAGQSPHPIATSTPNATFDGIAYVNDDVAMPFNTSQGAMAFWFKTTSDSGAFISSSTTASSSIYCYSFLAEGKLAINARSLQNHGVRTVRSGLHDGQWHHGIINSDGDSWSIFIDGVEEATEPLVGSNNGNWFADIGPRDNWTLGVMRRDSLTTPLTGEMAHAAVYSQPLTQAQIDYLVTGSGDDPSANLQASWPLTEGDGRTVYDVSGNANHGSIVGGTLQDIWANTSDAVRDHAIEYGGRMDGTVFVPGLLDGSNAADGNPLELLPKQHGNPKANLLFDPWAAPSLAPLNLPAASPPGELLRGVVPVETKFRSEENATPGSDGTAFADGDNRVFNTPDTLTGQDLTDAIEYIGRGAAPPVEEGVGAAAGSSTAAAVGKTAGSVGASAGTSTAAAVGAGAIGAVGAAAGSSVVFATSVVGVAQGNAAGTSTAQAVGSGSIQAIGAAAGTSIAAAAGTAVIGAVGAADGSSVVFATSVVGVAQGNAAGTSTAQAVGNTLFGAVGRSDGVATVVGLSVAVPANLIALDSVTIGVPYITATIETF